MPSCAYVEQSPHWICSLHSPSYFKYFIDLCICACLMGYAHVSALACREQKRPLDLLELESYAVLSCPAWVLGAKLSFSGRTSLHWGIVQASSTLNFETEYLTEPGVCHFSSKHPGSVCLCLTSAGATDASHHLGFMGAGYELRSSCLRCKHLSHGSLSLASHVDLLVFNLKSDRVPRAKKYCILSLYWDSFWPCTSEYWCFCQKSKQKFDLSNEVVFELNTKKRSKNYFTSYYSV